MIMVGPCEHDDMVSEDVTTYEDTTIWSAMTGARLVTLDTTKHLRIVAAAFLW